MNELELSHFLIPIATLSAAIMGIWKFWDKIVASITKGFVTHEELEKHDRKVREYILKEDDKNDKYIQTIDGKGQENREKIAYIKGNLDILNNLLINDPHS